ncbi:MAG: zinc ribbon domain-containing protein [Terracidiphilus sp.]
MELTCSRCHQTVQPGDCFCPYCGLPQLVYSTDGSSGPSQSERPAEPGPDASAIEWKPALRSALALGIPSGILCAELTRLGLIGALFMPVAAAWVVALYIRSRRPAWITIGAGARIGLVTGILGGSAAALTTGASLYAMRFWLHRGQALDAEWQSQINLVTQYWASMGFDAQQIATNRALMLSPEGHAGVILFSIVFLGIVLLALSVAGGALGARFIGRPRRTES